MRVRTRQNQRHQGKGVEASGNSNSRLGKKKRKPGPPIAGDGPNGELDPKGAVPNEFRSGLGSFPSLEFPFLSRSLFQSCVPSSR